MSRTEMEREISDWRNFGGDALTVMRNIINTRVSHTMTEHRAAEVVQQNALALRVVEEKLSEIMSGIAKSRDLPA